jgi:acetoin utilization protein AcuB
MLPVSRKGKLSGVVTDRDVKRASASDSTTLEAHELPYLVSTIKVQEIMTPDPVTVSEDATVEQTAGILLKHRISGVPVLNATGALVGSSLRRTCLRSLFRLPEQIILEACTKAKDDEC